MGCASQVTVLAENESEPQDSLMYIGTIYNQNSDT